MAKKAKWPKMLQRRPGIWTWAPCRCLKNELIGNSL
jgi:hypothetical protein